jgi:hypothetical protein
MYRATDLSVGDLSSVGVVANTFTTDLMNVSVMNFKTVYVNKILAADGVVQVGGANVLNTTILGTSITLGNNTVPVSFVGTLNIDSATNVETRDQNVMVNNGGAPSAVSAGLTVLSGNTTEIATARLNAQLDWEFNSPSGVTKTHTYRVSHVYTQALVSSVSIATQTIATTNSVTTPVLSLSGNLYFSQISVTGTTSTYGLSLNTMCATNVYTSVMSVTTSVKWPNTVTSTYLYTISVPSVSALNLSTPTASTNALVVTNSLSIGTLRGVTVSTYLFTPEISSLSVDYANIVVSGTAVVNTTNVDRVSMWEYSVTNNTSMPEEKLSMYGFVSIGRLSNIAGGLFLTTGSFLRISTITTRFLLAGGTTITGSVGCNTWNVNGSFTVLSLSCTTVTFNNVASISAVALDGQNAQTVAVGMSVLGRLSSQTMFVSDSAFMSLVSAVSVFTNKLTAPSFPTTTTSVAASNLTVLSRTEVPSIKFVNATTSPFRMEYNTVAFTPASLSSGAVAFTSAFATADPSVILQVRQGTADDTVHIVSGSISSGGFQWFCTANISSLYWIAAGL